MSRDVCLICKEVYSSTAENTGFYVPETAVEQLEVDISNGKVDGMTYLYRWFKEHCKQVGICHECRRMDNGRVTGEGS